MIVWLRPRTIVRIGAFPAILPLARAFEQADLSGYRLGLADFRLSSRDPPPLASSVVLRDSPDDSHMRERWSSSNGRTKGVRRQVDRARGRTASGLAVRCMCASPGLLGALALVFDRSLVVHVSVPLAAV